MSRTTQILLAVGLMAAAVAAYWYLALAPKRDEVAKLDTEVATKQAAVQTAQATANNYESTRKAYRKNYATVVRLGKAVPADDDVRSLVVQLDESARRAKIDFANISLTDIGSSQGATATQQAASTFVTQPFSFSFEGSFFRLSEFFNQLDRYVQVDGRSIGVTGRLLRIESFSLAPQSGSSTLTAADRRDLLLAPERAGPDRRRHRPGSRRRGDRHHRGRHDAGRRQHPAHDDRDRWSDRMKLLTDTWRQLVQRRLWPVALLLLGALVAVPFVLGKSEPAPVAAVPAAPAAGGIKANAASADPIVSMVSDEDSASTRRSLGTRHNPFASSAPKRKAKKTKSASSSDAATTEQTPSGGDAPASSGGGTSAPTTPTAPTQPTTTVPAHSVVVRWGATGDADLTRMTLQRDDPLPDSQDPALVYMGVKDGGKTAVFMLSDGLKADGDGTCVPKASCETIELQAGETEFFEYEGDPDATQFELDLVKIYQHATKVPATGEGSSTGSSTPSGSTSVTG